MSERLRSSPRSPTRIADGVTDAVVGSGVALMACANLVQGMWAEDLPWLNLTLFSLVIVVPAALFAATRRLSLSALAAVMLLSASLLLGLFQPAITGGASDKRLAMVFAVVFVFLAALLVLKNERRLTAFLATIVVAGSLVLLGQALIPDPLTLLAGRRTPVGQNSIGAGRIVGAALVILVTVALRQARGRSRLLLAVVAVPFAAGLVAAASRGPIIGVVVAVLFLLWIQPGLRGLTKILLLGVVLIALWVGYQALAERGSRVASSSGSGRWELYADAVQIASDNPWGVGWGNFSRYASSSDVASQAGESLYAHNIFLEFWLETGALGVLLFSVFVLAAARAALTRLHSPVQVALAALALDLMVGAMFSSDVVGNRLLWAVLGALFAGAALVRAAGTDVGAATGSATSRLPPRPRSSAAAIKGP